ncbi:HAD family hydrolase [Trichococcus shcherbakoviae]|uniref:HAD family hydrolase n=1 Tax=Trichococcus shcherbakoviae TaxID=2094020 RepID=UPI002AA7EAE1|nr:HAD hydrolase family protein [Trichococcus shcherbakoviae]
MEKIIAEIHHIIKDSNHVLDAETTLQVLQVTPEETMVFGDGMNDVEMMKSGRYSFAVRNAYPIIKDTAAFTTGRSNDEDAVSHTILQLLALQG